MSPISSQQSPPPIPAHRTAPHGSASQPPALPPRVGRSGEIRGRTAASAGGGLSGSLTSVRNTFKRLSDCDAGRIFGTRKQSLEKELQALGTAASRKPGIAAKDRGLAAYLSARSTLHRTLDGPELESLRRANDTVTKTRALLSYGRGNVTTDLANTQESYLRTQFGRQQATAYGRSLAAHAAMAVKMGAGNCGEHSEVAATSHARKLATGETLQQVSGARVDHAWAETRLPDGQRLIMDAWAEGPAVMSEDSRFSRQESSRKVHASFSQETAKHLADQKDKHLNSLRADPNLDRNWESFKDMAEKQRLRADKKHVFAPTLVISDEFKSSVREQQKHATDVAKAMKKALRLESPSSARVQLGNEIKATGAARALGVNVRQAVQETEPILSEVKKRFVR